ncbi:uncharacterized protein LOC131009600 [Salvia miltiorrhiza]|uniref:uncharacterized protein LOC131009600 n=1 Tax=Salvia miltiorrhiza TaxID=226208 RepID=UPI0025AD2CE3|nr:uncharacterized protein LOC131009600 [Salvia miltiorrhiza]
MVSRGGKAQHSTPGSTDRHNNEVALQDKARDASGSRFAALQQMSEDQEVRGPDLLHSILQSVPHSVFDEPTIEDGSDQCENQGDVGDQLVEDVGEDQDQLETRGNSDEVVQNNISQRVDSDDIALENAMKAQRLEQILAIAKAPMQVNTSKRRGRPTKQEQAVRAAGKISKQAEDCIKTSWGFRVAVVHGANNHVDRRSLWGDLSRFASGRTIFIGDFNAVKGAHERLSLVSPHRGSCLEFCNFINDVQMIESPTDGIRFTWSGRRFLPRHVESILDRVFFSQEFASDHSPLVLQCRRNVPMGRGQFCFLNMWTLHPNFIDMVSASWITSVDTLCPILRVMVKLKRLRANIRVWNKEIFGNVDAAIARGQRDLTIIQNRVSAEGYSDDLFEAEISCQAELNIALTRKNSLLQQKSRASWLKDGDRNTAFFHRIAKFKKRKTTFNRLCIDGVDVYDSGVIERHIINHFSSLFTDDGSPLEEQLVIDAYVDSSISEAQNTMLVRESDESEIAAAVFRMDANSTPGPDGFSGMFFQKCWNVIKSDVIMGVQTFFRRSYLPVGCNASNMVLIPKKENVNTVADLRPIVLSNFFFKIISKILALRLNAVAASHVSDNQFGLSGYFACSRGVRQGDPLSPILFGIAEDVLSRILSSCVESRRLVPMGFSRASDFPMHLFYADDIIIFCKATVRNGQKIQEILSYYGSISGQKCSQEKSNLYFARRVPTDRRRAIRRALGFSIGNAKTSCGQGARIRGLIVQSVGDVFARLKRKGARGSFLHFDESIVLNEAGMENDKRSGMGASDSSVQEVDQLVDNTYSCIERGDSTYFWKYDWLRYKLVDKIRIPHYMHDFLNFSVQDYFYDGVWHFSTTFVNRFPEVVADILLLPMTGDFDRRYWKHSVKGEVSVALAFSSIGHRFPQVTWGKWIWEPFIPIRRSILCWRIIHGRLPTLDALIRQGMIAPNGCPICFRDKETINHVMWQCAKVRLIWKEYLSWFDKDVILGSLDIHSFLVEAWNSSFSP